LDGQKIACGPRPSKSVSATAGPAKCCSDTTELRAYFRHNGKPKFAVDLDRIELTLLPASDDPDRLCYETQAKLLGIQESPRKHRVGVITVGPHPSGDTHVGRFIITLGPGANPAIAAVAGAWMETGSGRGVRLRLDEVETEASTAEALGDLLKLAFQARTRSEAVQQMENVDG
jgi:hypothetical protein